MILAINSSVRYFVALGLQWRESAIYEHKVKHKDQCTHNDLRLPCSTALGTPFSPSYSSQRALFAMPALLPGPLQSQIVMALILSVSIKKSLGLGLVT